MIERQEAERRQKVKASNKKAQAEASRKTAETKARLQYERVQTLRSEVFAAARNGDAAKVKMGVWENNVDAAGGEIKKGAEEFVKNPPTDPLESLMHIATARGDAGLVELLDTHSKCILLQFNICCTQRKSQAPIPRNAILLDSLLSTLHFTHAAHPSSTISYPPTHLKTRIT